MMKRIVIFLLALFATNCRADKDTEACRSRIITAVQNAQAAENASIAAGSGDAAATAKRNSTLRDLDQLLAFQTNATCLVWLTRPNIVPAAALRFKLKQLNSIYQQGGASSGSGNTTTVVSKSLAARVIAVAAEYGALTETTSGQTVTLQGELGGVPSILAKNGLTSSHSHLINVLDRFSYSVAFDASGDATSTNGAPSSTSSSAAQPVNFTGNAHTINSVGGKVNILLGAAGLRDKLSSALAGLDTKSDLRQSAVALDEAGSALIDIGTPGDPLDQWRITTSSDLRSSTSVNISGILAARLDLLLTAMEQALNNRTPESGVTLSDLILQYEAADSAYSEAVRAFLADNRSKPVLSFEYDENRPKDAPSNSVFRLIGEWNPNKNLALTFNAAASIYDSTPSTAVTGASRLRDVQVGAAGQFLLTKLKPIADSTASIAYYFQNQTSPAILDVTPGSPITGVTFTGLPSTATQVFGQTGNIHLMQGKFNFIPGFSNINIPVSVTWSNRTELITNSVWRAQLGITYDLSSLFGKK